MIGTMVGKTVTLLCYFLFSHSCLLLTLTVLREDKKNFIKPFPGTTKKCENKNLHEIHFVKHLEQEVLSSYKSNGKGHWTP